MRRDIQEKLLDQNRLFYDTYAQSFSATRHQIQPGTRRLLPILLSGNAILDLGCGNGNLFRALIKAEYQGTYFGLDNSPALFQAGLEALPPSARSRANFMQADLSKPDWIELLEGKTFETVVSFAVLHHIPGEDLQAKFFRNAAAALLAGGLFAISTWQPLKSERLKSRIIPWSSLGISEDDVLEGDLLMDWRAEAKNSAREPRYVHHFSEAELLELGRSAGLSLSESFYSDGREGNLALYQVWRKHPG